jgi:DNA-binding transcriptional regulator YhcF (GntR family)
MTTNQAKYTRIAGWYEQRIRDGDLRPGDRFPAVRTIEAEWQVARPTAAKAMAVLQRRGLIESRLGVGTFVADRRPPPPTTDGATLLVALRIPGATRADNAAAVADELIDAINEIRARNDGPYPPIEITHPGPRWADGMVDRILWNERDDDIDEIVLSGVDVHVEQMDDRCWWIGLYRGDDYWMGNFFADSRGRMRFIEQENHGIVWQHDDTHEQKGTDG